MGFKENLLHLKESLLQTDICNPYTFTGWEHKHRSRWWSMSLTGSLMLSTGSKTSAQWNEGAETFFRKQVNECWLRLHWDKGKFPSVFGFCETFFPQNIEFIMYEHCSNSQSVKNWTSFFLITSLSSPQNIMLYANLFFQVEMSTSYSMIVLPQLFERSLVYHRHTKIVTGDETWFHYFEPVRKIWNKI